MLYYFSHYYDTSCWHFFVMFGCWSWPFVREILYIYFVPINNEIVLFFSNSFFSSNLFPVTVWVPCYNYDILYTPISITWLKLYYRFLKISIMVVLETNTNIMHHAGSINPWCIIIIGKEETTPDNWKYGKDCW